MYFTFNDNHTYLRDMLYGNMIPKRECSRSDSSIRKGSFSNAKIWLMIK